MIGMFSKLSKNTKPFERKTVGDEPYQAPFIAAPLLDLDVANSPVRKHWRNDDRQF